MKRLTTKILTIAACAAMMLTAAPLANTQSVQATVKAQGTVDLTTQKLSIPKGVKTAMVNKTVTMVKARRYQVKAKFGTTVVKSQAKWKSSKPAVATVSTTGLITAKAPGTATIKVTYGKKSQTFKVKVVASHTHSWKTISKSTCATKGKKLCKTCGATGTTALSKTHNFKITKKPTCETKGVETCTVCGLKNTLPKTAHHYVTDTATSIEGRGKKTKYETSMLCPGCRWDMTEWTTGQRQAHQSHVDAMVAGKLSEDCWSAGYTGVAGAVRYEKRVKVQSVATYCEYCGAFDMDKTYEKDLYYVDAKGNKIGADEDPYAVWSYENYLKVHGFMLCPNCHDMEVMPGHTCQVCKTVAPTTASTTASVRKAAARKAVASPQDVITDIPDNNESFDVTDVIVSDNAAVSENTVSENTISDNEIISDNSVSENAVDEQTISENEVVTDNSNSELNTDITDQETGGDSVFKDTDSIVIEKTDDNDGIIIEDIDDSDDSITIEDTEEDDGNSDYDGSEGDVIEDE